MAQTAAHLVDHVIPHVPVRQWVLSLPIPLRLLLAAQPKLLTPVLQVVHRVITRFLLKQAGDASAYPNQRRMAALFVAALKHPTPPGVVADKLVEIADGGSWQLRHPVGSYAAPFLQWRAALSDEAWVEWGALDDDAWYARVKADFGIDARPEAG